MAALDFELRCRAASEGDGSAFSGLLEPYLLRLRLLIDHRARALLARDADPEDLLQEVLFTAWDRLASFRATGGKAALYPWLAGIARNVIGQRLRYQHREKRDERRQMGSPSRLEIPESLTSVGSRMGRQEMVDRVQAGLATLDEEVRCLLVEHYFEGRSLNELAREEGLSKSAIWQRLSGALKVLRDASSDP